MLDALDFNLPPQAKEALKRRRAAGMKTPEELRVEQANRVVGSLRGYDCPLCLNRGYSFYIGEGGYVTSKECSCMAIRKNLERVDKSGLSSMIDMYTFSTWTAEEQWQKDGGNAAWLYARKPTGWFFCCGSPGTGKTHLCTAICNELMGKGLSTKYMLWRDEAVKAKSIITESAGYQRLVEPLKRVKALYVDDLFKTKTGVDPSPGDVNLAFEVLNARYCNPNLITIISTELTIDELIRIDPAFGSRIYERSKGHSLDFTGRPNYRLRGMEARDQ